MSEVENLLNAYESKFGEGLPLCMMCVDEQELLQILRKCLETNTSYELLPEIKRLVERGVQF